ncbi:NTP transferase domain-containing protein [Sphingomonas flavescens]|uniref:NTP transferase domain-containing protein n=1 Tax=Sphingomonas flavescens TaxID=3132797 RepID=UPI0028051CCB|nr:NTP transferase domain-containing protein [Sphingomonas limnosediminicola]
MAIGALIGAYQEDDSGGLRALFPLAGRTLLEYQARCASAAGAAPVVVVVERVPQALQDAFERLRLDGVGVFPVSDVNEAVSRFEAGSSILLIGDGVAPTVDLVTAVASEGEPAVATVPDDEQHENFERIDAGSRWAGVAVVDAHLLGSTVAMLGDWDLQSTLLRRTIQEGARRIPIQPGEGEPLLVERPEQLTNFQRHMVTASRGGRTDWASRFILPFVEDFATEHLMETTLRPFWLVWAAVGLTIAGAVCFTRGWLGAGLILLLLSTPLDLIAARLATIRLKPFPAKMWSRLALWPASGLALLAIGLWETRHGTGWGSIIAALTACAFGEATRIEKAAMPTDGDVWLLSRRNAIFLAIPFALGGAWTAYLLSILIYAAFSFFIVQRVRHQEAS